MGGGTLHILPGLYNMRNAVYLHPNITLHGSGEKTILKKAASVVTPLVRETDWYEYGVQVKDTTGFTVGGAIMLRAKQKGSDWVLETLRATVTEIRGDVIFFDQRAEENFWMSNEATAATIFPIITAENVDDVRIEDIVLDGNREENEHINGNYSGAVFLQYCNRWSFKNVTAQNYNGDGFSLQVCDDPVFENCKALNNADLGFHPGSGDQRPIFRNCVAKANTCGIFFCWGVSSGIVDNCVFSENKKYGISIGHRDTDNIIQNCTIESNGELGIIFRDEPEFTAGHRNIIQNCTIRNNGPEKNGIGIDIQGQTNDITIRNNKFENTAGGKQQTAIRINKEAKQITVQDNTFVNCPVEVDDLRTKQAEK